MRSKVVEHARLEVGLHRRERHRVLEIVLVVEVVGDRAPSRLAFEAFRRRGGRGRRREPVAHRIRRRRRAGRGVVHLRRLLAVGAGVGRLEIDDVAQQDLALVELVPPDDDRLEGQRALAQARDHRLAAGLDALGDGDFALARQELDRAHLAQVHAHGIVGALARLGAAGGDRGRAGRLDDLAALALLLLRLGGLLFRLLRVLAVDDVDAHLAEHRVHVLDLVGRDLLGRQDGVQFVLGHPAALLGELQQPLDGGVGQIEKGAVGRFDGRGFAFGLRLVLLGHRESPSARAMSAGIVPVS